MFWHFIFNNTITNPININALLELNIYSLDLKSIENIGMRYAKLNSNLIEQILKEKDRNVDVSNYIYNLINTSIAKIPWIVLLFD